MPDNHSARTYPDAIVPFDPHRIAGILRRRRALIAAGALAGLLLAAALAYTRTVLYQSTAVIRVRDARQVITGGIAGEVEPRLGPLVDPMLSLIEVLQSRGVAGTVVDSLPILRLRAAGVPLGILRDVRIPDSVATDSVLLEFWDAGVRRAGAPPDSSVPYGKPLETPALTISVAERPEAFDATVYVVSREAAVNGLLAGLEVEARPSTDIINVHFTSADSALARQVAGRLVSIFREIDAQMAQEVSRKRREFLGAQLEQSEERLAAARRALGNFRATQRAFSARERFSAQQAGASALGARRAELDAERRLYQTLLARLAEPGAGAEGISALLSSPSLANNPVIRQGVDQLARYESQRDSLTAGRFSAAQSNPDVQRLNALITTARERLANGVRSVVSALDAQIASLDASRSRELASFRELSTSEEEETELAEEVETARRLAEQLRVEHQRASLAEAVNLGQVEIIDFAGRAVPLGLAPRTRMLLGLIIGLVLGCITALVVEYLRPAIRRQDDLDAALGSLASVVIPRELKASGRNGKTALVAASDPSGGGAEAYRALRTTLLFSAEATGVKSLVVTSAMPGEGKTTVASNLAAVFAQQGLRVLLVDADLRRARLHHLFHVQRSPGLTSLLAGAATPEQAIRTTSVPNLSFLPSGAPAPNPAELVGSNEMSATLEFLTGHHDIVILDSPPLLAAADASILATLVEGVVMVVRAGSASEEVVKLAQQQLASVGARVVAAVLNDPDAEVKRYGGQYYFSGYTEVGTGGSKDEP